MRVKTELGNLLWLCRTTVIVRWELADADGEGAPPRLVVWVRTKVRRRGRCGRSGVLSSWYDRGDGERRWRHVDVAFATCELVAAAPRVN